MRPIRGDRRCGAAPSGVIVTLTLSMLAAPLAAEAQQAGKVPRLGVLFPAELPSPEEPHLAAFRQTLRHLGYVEGQTVAIESRYALGRGERFPDLVAELVGFHVDILVVGSSPAACGCEACNTGDSDRVSGSS